MLKWGIVITVVYALVVTLLIVPGFAILGGDRITEIYELWLTWVWIGIMIGGQAVLLFLRVDTSLKRLKPRTHLWVSMLTTSLLTGLLFFAAVWSLLAGILGDRVFAKPLNIFFGAPGLIFLSWIGVWILWTIIFALYAHRSPHWMDKIVGWLLKGSVLELLIAIPCHVVTRHREDCSAPTATAFGIATGVAIMLLSFGPSVLLLYQKRLQQYKQP